MKNSIFYILFKVLVVLEPFADSGLCLFLRLFLRMGFPLVPKGGMGFLR